VLAESGSSVFRMEQASSLQFRDHLFGEVAQSVGKECRHDVEAVGGSLREPLLQGICHLDGSPGKCAVSSPSGETENELPYGGLVALDQIADQFVAALVAVDLFLRRQVRKLSVQRIGEQIELFRQ